MYKVRFVDPTGYERYGELKKNTIFAGGLEFELDQVNLLSPVKPSKIVCVGLNYERHAMELGFDLPSRPMLFLKAPNSVANPHDTVQLPANKNQIDYEAELAVIISKQCRNVNASEADEFIAGYTALNDISNRDDQKIEQNWIRGKAFDSSAPLGPVLATADEVPPDARITLSLNGELKQDSRISDLIFTIPDLIQNISKFMTLEEGDVIATGTPEGVGPLTDGDDVLIEIEGIPGLNHQVAIPH